MLLDTPKLVDLGAPFVSELVGSFERDFDFVNFIGMNDLPQALACGEPDQMLDRCVVGPHRLEQGLDSRGVGFRHRREWIERQQEFVGLLFGDIEY